MPIDVRMAAAATVVPDTCGSIQCPLTRCFETAERCRAIASFGFVGGGANFGYRSIMLSCRCVSPQFLPERFEFPGELRKIDFACSGFPGPAGGNANHVYLRIRANRDIVRVQIFNMIF